MRRNARPTLSGILVFSDLPPHSAEPSLPQQLRRPLPSIHQEGPQRPQNHPAIQDRHFRPGPAGLQIPAGSARVLLRLERLPESSASRQSLEIEQNRPLGEGKAGRRGCGRGGLGGPPKRSRPPRAFRRGLLCARPGSLATPASGPLPAPPPPRTLPPHAADLWLGTRRSLVVPGRRSSAAYSRFPQAPGAHGFRSAGRGAGGNAGAEARSCHGDAR